MIQVILFSGYLINKAYLCEKMKLASGTEEEILSQGFHKWGTDFFPMLNGLFSVVLFDSAARRYYCCRDRFGGRGLYYTFTKDGAPVFSETIRGLLSKTGRPVFRKDMLEVYLSYSYIPGEDTAFEKIQKPLPGYWYCFTGKAVHKERYYTPRFAVEEHTEEQWEERLTDTLNAVFDGRQAGGASLLSSGIDSAYLSGRLSVKDTYTAVYKEENFSENREARKFSGEINARHHEVLITPEAYLASVPETMKALEQPTGDASAEVLLLLSATIKNSADSCYSGEGIDELLLGYYMSFARAIPPGKTLYEEEYIGTTFALTEAEKKRFLKQYAGTRKMEYVQEAYALTEQEDRLHQAAMADLLVWMNGNLLPNVYSMEKTVGLQYIMPYLDNRLYDLALKIPANMNNTAEQTKLLFRRAAERILPPESAQRPKRGFPVPIRLWVKRPEYVKKIKQAFMSDTAFSFFNQQELIAYYDGLLTDTKDEYSWRVIWCIYCFIVWYDAMINPHSSVQRWQVYEEAFNREEAWSRSEYPEASLHYMRQAGCLVTSCATLLRLYGLEKEENSELFNPWVLLQRLKKMHGFTPAADLNLSVLQDMYPIRYITREPYSAERLRECMENREMCLLQVPGAHDTYHFVVPVEISDGDVRIIDSGWNHDRVSCFTQVFSILRFEKTEQIQPAEPRERIVQKALSYIGVRESYLGANDVPFNTHYYGRAVAGPEYPWCVAFIWDVFRQCGLSSLFYDGGKTASCMEFYEWARKTGRLVAREEGRRGDIALYDWFDEKKPVHAGIILGDYCCGYYRTIEGNTSEPEKSDDCGCVMVQRRRFGGIFAIIRPDYEAFCR